MPSSTADGCTLLEPSLADRSDEKESIDPKVVCVHASDKQPQPKKLDAYNIIYSYCITELISNAV